MMKNEDEFDDYDFGTKGEPPTRSEKEHIPIVGIPNSEQCQLPVSASSHLSPLTSHLSPRADPPIRRTADPFPLGVLGI